MTPRFYCTGRLAAGTEIALDDNAAHHALRVLRLQAGDEVTLFGGTGGEFSGRLLRIDGRRVVIDVGAYDPVERESPLAITLVQGLASADRMDYAVQKAVELGVAGLQPVVTARSVSKLDDARADKRVAHWRQIAIASCEQCGRNRVPDIHAPRALHGWLALPSPASQRLLLAPDAGETLADLTRPVGGVELLVGPEGGLTAAEATAALSAGFRAVRAGPRILRTETAAPAALAALNVLWGDWR